MSGGSGAAPDALHSDRVVIGGRIVKPGGEQPTAVRAEVERFLDTQQYSRENIRAVLGMIDPAAEQRLAAARAENPAEFRRLVTELMDLGPNPSEFTQHVGQTYRATGGGGVSPHTQQLVDEEVRRIVDGCYDDALRILGENRERLEALARALLERETLDQEDAYRVADIVHGRAPTG